MTFVRVASTDEIKPGHGKPVDVEGVEIAVFNVNGNFYAIDNACKHRGGPLGEGDLDGDIVTCPLHGWQYNVTNGNCVTMPAHVKSFEVKVEGNDILVNV